MTYMLMRPSRAKPTIQAFRLPDRVEPPITDTSKSTVSGCSTNDTCRRHNICLNVHLPHAPAGKCYTSAINSSVAQQSEYGGLPFLMPYRMPYRMPFKTLCCAVLCCAVLCCAVLCCACMSLCIRAMRVGARASHAQPYGVLGSQQL